MNEELNKDVLNFNVGDKVTGTVVKLEEKQVLVDIGFKSEGIIPISELANLHVETPEEVVQVGDEIELIVKKANDEEIVLSKKAVDADKAWEELVEKYEAGTVFETTVKEVVKGGLVVDVGLRGFIPASLVETFFVEDFSDYVNKSLAVKIVDLDQEQNRIILSHRAVVEQEAGKKKEALLNDLEVGQVLDGVVQRLTDFGVFVDIGGVDGLVHISQLAHEHVDKPSDVVKEGDEIKVEVISIDRDHERISLSHKNTLPGPWTNIDEKVKEGDILTGKVKRLVSFGAFIEILPGVEGLVHISQIANRHIGNPSEVLEVEQEVKVKVLSVDEDNQRISLSIKELEEDEVKADYAKYEKTEEQSNFQLGDLIGDKLNKYK